MKPFDEVIMYRCLVFLPLFACGPKASAPNHGADATQTPPLAAQQPHTHIEHGVERDDPFHWLMERENPDVIAYLEAENAFTASQGTPEGFRKHLFDEMVGRIQETDLSVPVKDGAYWYYTRTEDGLDYPIRARKLESMDAEEEVLLDLNTLDHEYIGLGAYAVSPDHNLLAYSLDLTGREIYTMRFIDLRTGEHLGDVIEGITRNVAWANDNTTVFYTRQDEALALPIARTMLANPEIGGGTEERKVPPYVWRPGPTRFWSSAATAASPPRCGCWTPTHQTASSPSSRRATAVMTTRLSTKATAGWCSPTTPTTPRATTMRAPSTES